MERGQSEATKTSTIAEPVGPREMTGLPSRVEPKGVAARAKARRATGMDAPNTRLWYLCSGIEEAEYVEEACRPRVFVVNATLDASIGEIFAFDPASFAKDGEEQIGIANVAVPLPETHVKPETDSGGDVGLPNEAEDGTAVPPDGGRHDSSFGEEFGVIEGEEE